MFSIGFDLRFLFLFPFSSVSFFSFSLFFFSFLIWTTTRGRGTGVGFISCLALFFLHFPSAGCWERDCFHKAMLMN